MITTDRELVVYDTLYEPEFTRVEVAKQLNVTVKTVERYLAFGAGFIPELRKYINEDGYLNGKRLLSSDLVFVEEIKDLKKTFSHSRVVEILTRKYSQAEE